MLNLKAAKELAAKELGSQSFSSRASSTALDKASSRSSSVLLAAAKRRSAGQSTGREAEEVEEAVTVKPLLSVGDRVEYRSDTHKQWLQGVVQRVREGGALYDLDVKKGAQASKLRRAVAPAESLFDRVDRNHDGVITRSEFRGALESNVIEGGGSSLLTTPLPPPLTLTGSTHSPPQSLNSTGRLSERKLLRADETVVPAGHYDTALQARQLHSELSQVTRSIHRQQLEWAELAGRDMASRAGAVTVRKMVETTKMLLQNLEGALILRAGFIAGCFHTWRFEVELTKASLQHRHELEQHHDAWSAHFQHHQQAFEDELRAKAEHQMTGREKRRQQADLIIDQWAEGERKGTLRQSYRAWAQYALKEKCLKRAAAQIHTAVFGWAEGKAKGTAHACLLSWRHLAAAEKEVRQKEAELEKLHGTYQEQLQADQARRDAEMARKLREIEARRKDRSGGVEAILLQWEKGKKKGSLAMVWKSWATYAKGRRARQRRQESMQLQLRKWLEGEVRGTLHCTWLHWKAEAQKQHQARLQEEARAQEAENLRNLLEDERKRHQDTLRAYQSEEERLREAAKAQVQYLASRWAGGDKKGTLTSVFRAWCKYVKEVKALAKKRQSVHVALSKALEGEARGIVHLALLNWHGLMLEERRAREMEQRQEEANTHWNKLLQETQEEHDRHLQQALAGQKSLKTKAHHVTEMLLKRWIGGDRKGLLSSAFQEWKDVVEAIAQAELQSQTVKDSVLRFIEGDQRAAMHSCMLSWKNFVSLEAKHVRTNCGQQSRIDALEAQLERMIASRAKRLAKYAEMLGGASAPVLKGLVFNAWKQEAMDVRAELEQQRLREVELAEMERHNQMAIKLKQERAARVLDALGCKRTRVVLMEYFAGWAYVYEKAKDEWIHKLNHSSQMVLYSEFVIGQKLKKDAASLLASSFAEWHHEAKILAHQAGHESMRQKQEELLAYVQQLERQRTDLQEQLQLYYQQIDLITETLQKELKTKEELASELREAYDKMRKSSQMQMTTPSTMASLGDVGMWSRASSTDRRQLKDATPRAAALCRTPRGSAASEGKLKSSASTSLERLVTGDLPPAPTLPKPRTSRGLDAGSHDGSPTLCDWGAAVQRMSEEGLVKMKA